MNSRLKSFFHDYWCVAIIILITPLLLFATIQILPTHDDWFGATKPDFDSFFIKERFLFYGYHWRPFDTWIGYIVGRNPQLLFPAFNHICVVVGHVLCSFLIYRLLRLLQFDKFACNISTLYFFITPSAMATLFAVDSQNQVYSLVWGILAFFLYIHLKTSKYIIWFITIFIAALCKENGLMWALICPILAFGFDLIDKKTLKKDILIGLSIMLSYALAVFLLPKDVVIHPEYIPDTVKVIRNIIKFLVISFVTFDYVYILHQQHRNLLVGGLLFVITLPFLYFLVINIIKTIKEKRVICVIICLLIAAAPHLLTIYSMMHVYAGLLFITILIAYSVNKYGNNIKHIFASFVLFIIAAFIIDSHLWYESNESGLTGKRMSQEAISKTGCPTDSIFSIVINDDYQRLSSFCVAPQEAFGWSFATQYETNYQWPNHIYELTIDMKEEKKIDSIITRAQKKGYHTFWIVRKDGVTVLKY